MPKTVSSTEAQAQFGAMLKWTKENEDEVIVKPYGEPAAVLMSYEEYQEVVKLRERQRRERAWATLESIREQVQDQNSDLSVEDAYRLAGFSEEIVQETVSKDEELHSAAQP